MLSKQVFCEAINEIERLFEYADKKTDFYKDYQVTFYAFEEPTAAEILIKVLEEVMCDGYNDISYFIYELDFGKKYKTGMIIDQNNNDIDLSTVEKLYDYLIKLKRESSCECESMDSDDLSDDLDENNLVDNNSVDDRSEDDSEDSEVKLEVDSNINTLYLSKDEYSHRKRLKDDN